MALSNYEKETDKVRLTGVGVFSFFGGVSSSESDDDDKLESESESEDSESESPDVRVLLESRSTFLSLTNTSFFESTTFGAAGAVENQKTSVTISDRRQLKCIQVDESVYHVGEIE